MGCAGIVVWPGLLGLFGLGLAGLVWNGLGLVVLSWVVLGSWAGFGFAGPDYCAWLGWAGEGWFLGWTGFLVWVS
jgi:hypothetical protein